MSGLVAAHGPFDAALGERMLSRLAHRGPDGSGTRQVSANAWLGSHYLTIVDPDGGQQPVRDATGSLWLIGDGEIYNHQRLRATLDRPFHTRSDLETALVLLDEHGIAAFEHLWGTFALVAASQDGRFGVARDTFGLAPLYWARRGSTTVFASEMKAFDPDWLGDVEPFPRGKPRRRGSSTPYARPSTGHSITRWMPTCRSVCCSPVASTPASSPPWPRQRRRSEGGPCRPSPWGSKTVRTLPPPAPSLTTSAPTTTNWCTRPRRRSPSS